MRICLLFIIFIFSTSILKAQIQITQTDAENFFAVGWSWVQSSSDNPQVSMDIGTASASPQSWIIPAISWTDSNVLINVAPASTPYLTYFPSATHSQYTADEFGGYPAVQYTYMRIQNDGIYELGRALEVHLGGTDTVMVEIDENLVFPFPLSYGQVLEDSRDSINYGSGVYAIITNTLSVDAFGNITFAFGTYQALRVSSIQRTVIYQGGNPTDSSLSSSFIWITNNGGLFEADLDTSSSTSGVVPLHSASMTQFVEVTNVKNENVHQTPLNFQLNQNYPNPFNPQTIISYQLPVSGNVTLKVYDVLGREVAMLVNEYLEAGRHKVTFKAGNLSSGVYIYRLQSESFTETKTMTLLR